MSKIALIVAVDKEWGIGKNNDLMWHLPADMKFFRETTTGQIIVTGRKNYDSIPERFRPLPNRENAVLTRNADYEAPGAKIFSSLDSCLDYYKNETERTVFIIGTDALRTSRTTAWVAHGIKSYLLIVIGIFIIMVLT